MAIGIEFDKAKALYFLDCLANGKPIEKRNPAGWPQGDMIALAGACYFAALSHGPALHREDLSSHAMERQEAIEQEFYNDLHAAIEFHGQLP